ncbi:MAG: sporulation membrane protein YtaF [Mycobacterium leprae]
MTPVFHLILIGLTASLDNLAVGIAYGIRRIKVPVLSNLAMAGIAFLFTAFSAWVGDFTARFFPREIANAIGAALLISVGLWIMLTQSQAQGAEHDESTTRPTVFGVLQEPEEADTDRSGVISLKESLILGVAVSINCFANGLAAGLWQLGAFPPALSTAAFSYLTLWAGCALGVRYATRWFGARASLAAGCLLILLGLHQLL